MRQLLLMRHAKSDWNADYGRDHDRPLNDRGISSARIMGRVLSQQGLAPDLVITSTATRARSTAELAAESGSWEAPIRLEERLYGAGPDEVLEIAAESTDVARLMMIGHQPTWSMVVTALTGQPMEMKTATVAVVDLQIANWIDLAAGDGALSAVYQPRDYLG